MQILQGSVIISTAGHDKGQLFIAVGNDDRNVFICDGKERKLEKPKKKNIKHVKLTGEMITVSEITDKKLRRLLREMTVKVMNNN